MWLPLSGSSVLLYKLQTTFQGRIIPLLRMRNWGLKSHSWGSKAGFLLQGSLLPTRFQTELECGRERALQSDKLS